MITIIVIVLLVIIAVSSFFYYKERSSGNISAKSNISEIKKINEEISKEEITEIKNDEYYPVEKIYDILHRMSNTKIIAEDNQIWGRISMDPEYIASLKSLVEKVDYKDKDYMLEVLSRWENNNFSKAVEEHNYFWKKLGGTIGKAISLKE
jgi:predicted Abi (CAAX) family protease